MKSNKAGTPKKQCFRCGRYYTTRQFGNHDKACLRRAVESAKRKEPVMIGDMDAAKVVF